MLKSKAVDWHKAVKEGIRCLLDGTSVKWVDSLPLVAWNLNNQCTSTMQLSPYEVYFCRINRSPTFNITNEELDNTQLEPELLNYLTTGKYVEEMVQRKKDRKESHNETAIHTQFEVGDEAFVRHIVVPGTPSALQPKFSGPYEVVAVESPFVFVYEKNGKRHRCHVRNAKRRGQ